MEDRGTALIAWAKTCIPKKQGGLGILDIATHNKCPLMKHLHKFIHHADLPWVKLIWDSYYPNGTFNPRPVGSFWWKGILKLFPLLKQWSKGVIGKGNTICFWQDNWGNGALQHKYPALFSFSIKENMTVQEFLQVEDSLGNFHTPLSIQAHQQLQDLQLITQNIQLSDDNDN